MANHDLKDFIETRHFLFEYDKKEDLNNFLNELKPLSKKIMLFDAKIGERYISIKGIFDPSDVLNIITCDDIIYKFRKQGVKKLKEYLKKPTPQTYYKGEWEQIL